MRGQITTTIFILTIIIIVIIIRYVKLQCSQTTAVFRDFNERKLRPEEGWTVPGW